MKIFICLAMLVALALADKMKPLPGFEGLSPEEAAVKAFLDKANPKQKAKYGFDGQCISLSHECQRAARNPIQRIQCLVQAAACMGAKAVGCSGHCIAPMVQCKLANIGNWAGIFKCCADFIGCAVGGCVGGGGGGPGTGGGEGPPPGLGYSAVEDKMSPEEAAMGLLSAESAAYGFNGECIGLSIECQRAARNPIQRIQCLAQGAACMGAKALGCSGHCIAPMIQCKLANIGNWAGIFKCCADFIGCAVGGCVGGGGGGPGTGGGEGPPPGLGYSAVEDEISPEEAAMELLSAEGAAYGFNGECISLGIECQRAARNPIQRIQCLAQGAACMGAKALGCSGHCIAPMIQCKLANIGNWAGIFKCCADFIGCAVGGCVGGGGGGPGTGGGEGPPPGLGYSAVEDKMSPEEAAMGLLSAEGAAYGFNGECISLGIECQRAARNPIQRIQCLAQGAACMGAKALGCSGHCIAPMIQCKLANIGNWAGIFKCCADFIGCAVGGCVGGGGGGLGTGGGEGPPPGLGYSAVEDKMSPEEAAMGLLSAEGAAYGFNGECISLGIECQRAARNPIQRIQCLAQGAACMGAKALGCSGHCIAPMIQCKLANIGNWAGIFKCCADFIGCAVGGCVGGGGGGPGTGGGEGPPPGLGYSAVEDKMSPEEAAMELLSAEGAAYGFNGECISLGIECQRAARNPIQRIQCLAQGAACMGAKALGCSSHCIAPMIQCKLANIGNWAGIFKCCADFIGCAVGGCVGGGGGGPGTGGGEGPPPGLGYSAVEDKMSPEEAAMGLLSAEGAAYGFNGECISLGIECQRAARNPIQRIQCLAQGAACMGAKALGCSSHCIAPMIQCKLANIGNWAGIFKCCADFIGCAVGGCVGGGGGGPGTGGGEGPPPGLGYSAVEKEMSPIDAAVEMYYSDKDNKAAYNLFDDTCRMMHGECNRAARNFIQKMQCLAQLGMCIGAKAVGCSGHCIPPMIQCKLGAIGNWPAMFKCCADFIGCAAGGCLTGGAGGGGGGGPEIPGGGGPPPGGMMFAMEKEDYTPYEFAIATAFNDTDFAYGMDFQRCLAEHQQCAGNPDIKQKVGCFLRFGACIGLQAVGCTAMCVPELGLCTALNIGNWPGTFVCATKFVFCAKNHCLH